MAIAVVLVVVGVAGMISARVAALWWARQPLGVVRLDGRVEVRVGARRVDAEGRCGDSGELAIAAGRLEMAVAGRTRLFYKSPRPPDPTRSRMAASALKKKKHQRNMHIVTWQ